MVQSIKVQGDNAEILCEKILRDGPKERLFSEHYFLRKESGEWKIYKVESEPQKSAPKRRRRERPQKSPSCPSTCAKRLSGLFRLRYGVLGVPIDLVASRSCSFAPSYKMDTRSGMVYRYATQYQRTDLGGCRTCGLSD